MARRLAVAVVAFAVFVAVFADCIASDRPLLLHLDGETYVLPNMIDYEELDGLAGEDLSDRMTDDDWALWPPVRHHPVSVRSGGRLEPQSEPSPIHWLGTDDRGRDVAARLIHGTRATGIVAVGASLLALSLGVALALLGAGLRRPAEDVVLGACDIVAAIPALLLVIAAQGLMGTTSLWAAVVLIAVPRAADTARIALASLGAALVSPYCEAARAVGASRARVVIRHALPQAVPQLAVATALTAATAVLAEAALSFLGFGTPPPAASWGELLKQALENDLRWWLMLPPGVAILAMAAAFGALAQPKRA